MNLAWPNGKHCESCKWLGPEREYEDGFECRRHPPAVVSVQPIGDGYDVTVTRWPVVSATNWCGEWIYRQLVETNTPV